MSTLQTILRMPDVLKASGYSASRLYDLIKADKFPKPIPLAGGRAMGWLESDIVEWQSKAIARKGERRWVPPPPRERAKRKKQSRQRTRRV